MCCLPTFLLLTRCTSRVLYAANRFCHRICHPTPRVSLRSRRQPAAYVGPIRARPKLRLHTNLDTHTVALRLLRSAPAELSNGTALRAESVEDKSVGPAGELNNYWCIASAS